MFVLRPCCEDDLESLFQLVQKAEFGLTSLPKDKKLLQDRIKLSTFGFAAVSNEPKGENYLFVLENLNTGEVQGITGIISKVGGFEPFYAYRVEEKIIKNEMLKVSKKMSALHLVEEHDGPTEIGSLFLDPNLRGSGLGRLLSLSRFLFMACFPNAFDSNVIAELRGVIDEDGGSSFWDAIGKHFFEIEFPKADHLSMVNKRFIADLMPRHPIYISLLPSKAQKVIGQVHPNTKGARRLLEEQGFKFNRMVDIFEAGPIYGCLLQDVDSFKECHFSILKNISEERNNEFSQTYIVAKKSNNFRSILTSVKIEDNGITLDQNAALALKLKLGEEVLFLKVDSQIKKQSSK